VVQTCEDWRSFRLRLFGGAGYIYEVVLGQGGVMTLHDVMVPDVTPDNDPAVLPTKDGINVNCGRVSIPVGLITYLGPMARKPNY
jgi:hypothetical protein